MGGNNTTWMNTAVLVTCIRNFRMKRGPIVGILKGYIALSTAIFTDICSALLSNNASSFLLMLTFIPGTVCVTSMIFMHPVPCAADEREEKEEAQSFSIFNVIAIILALYLLAFAFLGYLGDVLSIFFTCFLLLLLAAPLVIPIKILIQEKYSTGQQSFPWKSPFWKSKFVTTGQEPKAGENPKISVPVPNNEDLATKSQTWKQSESIENQIVRKPRIGEDHTILQAIQKFDFWLLFFAFLWGGGTEMAVINNMGQS